MFHGRWRVESGRESGTVSAVPILIRHSRHTDLIKPRTYLPSGVRTRDSDNAGQFGPWRPTGRAFYEGDRKNLTVLKQVRPGFDVE